MSSLKRSCLFVAALALGIPGSLPAQSTEEVHHVTVSAGAGFTAVTNEMAGKLDHGGNIQLNGGYFFNERVGITGNFMFSRLGLTGPALRQLNQPDGSARVYALTADPTLRVPLGHGVSVYGLVGGGYMRRTVEFTQPTLASTLILNPWWGYFGPALVPINVVLGSVISDSSVFDVGAGINIGMPRVDRKVFLEVRYFRGFTGNTDTTLVPITFGFRW